MNIKYIYHVTINVFNRVVLESGNAGDAYAIINKELCLCCGHYANINNKHESSQSSEGMPGVKQPLL